MKPDAPENTVDDAWANIWPYGKRAPVRCRVFGWHQWSTWSENATFVEPDPMVAHGGDPLALPEIFQTRVCLRCNLLVGRQMPWGRR